MRVSGEFLLHEEVLGNIYGITRAAVTSLQYSGKVGCCWQHPSYRHDSALHLLPRPDIDPCQTLCDVQMKRNQNFPDCNPLLKATFGLLL